MMLFQKRVALQARKSKGKELYIVRLFFVAIVTCVSALAATTTLSNTTNAAMGMDFISGDSFRVEITGAVSYQPVTMQATKNGVPTTPSPWYAGQTDSVGHFVLTGVETNQQVAEYTEQWYVGGVAVGPLLDFEVIYLPTGLTVKSFTLASFPAGCQGLTYGIYLDVIYQIRTTGGAAVTTKTGIPMIPTEHIVTTGGYVFDNNIGPVPGYPTSTEYAAFDGSFHDVPVGFCANGPISSSSTQSIALDIGDRTFPVRGTTTFSGTTNSPGHGSVTNGSDITASR